MNRKLQVLVIVLVLFQLIPISLYGGEKKQGNISSKQRIESTIKNFFTGISFKDKKLIKQAIIQSKNESVLWEGPKPSKQMQVQIKQVFSTMQIKELKPGDKFTLLNGKEIIISDSMVSKSKKQMLVTIAGEKIPITLVLEKDVWKIDATPFIKASLAARMRMKNFSGTSQ